MNQYFPCHFSENQLRVSSQISWIHAIAICTNGTRELREATQTGWIHATPEDKERGDKAGFHAIAPIGGIDEQPKLCAILGRHSNDRINSDN